MKKLTPEQRAAKAAGPSKAPQATKAVEVKEETASSVNTPEEAEDVDAIADDTDSVADVPAETSQSAE